MKIFKIYKKSSFQKFSTKIKKIGFWAICGLKFGFLAKNNVGLCPPDLKRPTGGDFSGILVMYPG